jgi:predicted PurR-regulated permease PerM
MTEHPEATGEPDQPSGAALPPEASPPVSAPAMAEPGPLIPPPPDSDRVPTGIRVAAAWSWRLLVLAGLGYVLLLILGTLSEVVIPVAIALLLTALLSPPLRLLVAWGWHRTLATVTVFLLGLGVVIGLVWVVVAQFIDGYPELSAQAGDGVSKIKQWLIEGPFRLSEDQITGGLDAVKYWFTDNKDLWTTGALRTATTAGHVITGLVLALFTLFFFLRDGAKIWTWLTRVLLPVRARPAVHGAALRAWRTLGGYARAAVLVATVDAVGIGAVLFIVGVPLALPLAALVFLSSFIPIVGALVSGIVATLVALVTVGPVGALIVIAGVIAVQQVEAHFLQPVLLGRGVNVHPLAVVLSLAAGAMLAGIVGALLAVPLVASLNSAISYLVDRSNDNLDDTADRVEREVERREQLARHKKVDAGPAG